MAEQVVRISPPVRDPAPRKANGFLRTWLERSNLAVNLSILVLITLTFVVTTADILAPHDPNSMNLLNRLDPPVWQGGSWEFPLGTDALGRDLLSRIFYGGRISLAIGGASSLLGLAIGTLLGLISGYARGWADHIIMYLVDVQLSLPFVLLAVAVALVLGTSLAVLIFMAALATWPVYTRVVRGIVLSLREREFVIASRAIGATNLHIMLRHIFPNMLAPLLVLITLSVGRIILLESGLSFLGIGVQPPTPSWGNMINEGREYLSTAWWIANMPGIALVLLTMAVGTIGDWLRDVSDVSIG
ncbi:MAG: ABC transporter permease [Chloroflexi bacterium]|nr:ABC transporter permease [Chloroflexota bacterium]